MDRLLTRETKAGFGIPSALCLRKDVRREVRVGLQGDCDIFLCVEYGAGLLLSMVRY
jgi:hypothetical protein